MADVNRKTVDELILHHAVTPLWEDKSKEWLAQWFSDNGFARAYSSNPANWSGLINPYTGARSYSQAHFAGQRVTSATPDATAEERQKGYRLVQLVQDVWGQITWHAGNWEHNRRSIGIENLGDYRNYTLRENDAKVIADFWRPQDRKLNGATAVYGHQEVSDSATACPAQIMEMRGRIVDLINASDSGWPATKPTWVKMDNPRKMKAKSTISLVNVVTGAIINNYPAGSEFDFNQKTDWNGKTWVRTVYSSQNNVDNGFDSSLLQEIDKIEVKEDRQTSSIPFSKTTIEDSTLPIGETKLVTVGVDGIKVDIYEVTFTDGVETKRVLKSSNVLTQPVDEVTAIGTKEEPTPEPYPNWFLDFIKKVIEFLTGFFKKG